jgi:hypothetical protein
MPVKISSPIRQAWHGWARVEAYAKNGKRGLVYREFSSLCELPKAIRARIHFNPITAADEKIPLSVGDVNNKPQYLVFSLHSPHLVRKYRQSPVESSKAPKEARAHGLQLCPKYCAQEVGGRFWPHSEA